MQTHQELVALGLAREALAAHEHHLPLGPHCGLLCTHARLFQRLPQRRRLPPRRLQRRLSSGALLEPRCLLSTCGVPLGRRRPLHLQQLLLRVLQLPARLLRVPHLLPRLHQLRLQLLVPRRHQRCSLRGALQLLHQI